MSKIADLEIVGASGIKYSFEVYPLNSSWNEVGAVYLSPEEVAVERRGKMGRVLLENVLAAQLKRLNRIRAKGRELAFDDGGIASAIEALRDMPVNDGLGRTSEKVYDLLTLGKSVDQNIEGETKGHTLRFIDWEHPRNNAFHVTAEFEVARTASHETRRPDIVCFVNGIPFVVIECKLRLQRPAHRSRQARGLAYQEIPRPVRQGHVGGADLGA